MLADIDDRAASCSDSPVFLLIEIVMVAQSPERHKALDRRFKHNEAAVLDDGRHNALIVLADLVSHIFADFDIDRCALRIDGISFHLGRLVCCGGHDALEMGALVLAVQLALDYAVDHEIRITPDRARKMAIILGGKAEVP